MKTKIEVKGVTLTPGKDNLLALANLQIGEDFRINGLRVLKSGTGNVFVSMPGRQKTANGKPVLDEHGKAIYSDIFHGITKEAHDNVQSAVLSAYNAKVESAKASANIAAEAEKTA